MATRPGGAPAFGAATDVTPKFVSPADSPARWSAAHGGQAFFAYSTNYLIDVHNARIVDVEPTTAIREAEVLAAKRMIERAMNHFRSVSRPPSGPQRLRLGRDARLAGLRAGLRAPRHGVRQIGAPGWHFSRDEFTYDHDGDAGSCSGLCPAWSESSCRR